MLDRRTFMIALGLGALTPGRALADLEPVLAGEVATVVGESTGVQRGGERRQLAVGSKVFLEDMLGTGVGARLGVRLGKDTSLQLGERTRVRVNALLVNRGGALVLERGAVLFDRPDAEPSGEMNVTTPFGLIAARGTRFFAGPMQGGFAVFVDHGVVDVTTKAGRVTLTDGLGTDLRSLKAAPTAPKAWGAARIAAAMAMVE